MAKRKKLDVANIKPRAVRSARKRKKKDVIGPKLKEYIESKDNRILVGVDMSRRNPGLCVINPVSQEIQLYFFTNAKTLEKDYVEHKLGDDHSIFPGFTLSCTSLGLMDRQSDKTMGRFPRFVGFVKRMVAKIPANSHVCIEDYIQKHVDVRHFPTHKILIEVGSVLRTLLTEKGMASMIEYKPGTLKEKFSLTGAADKEYMFHVFMKDFGLPDIISLVRKDGQTIVDGLKNPYDDMVDAMAAALCNLI